MILQRRGDGLIAITQKDHARLGAEMTGAWGADDHPRLPEWDGLIEATLRHDDGWIEWDEAPSLTDRSSPNDFLTVPTDERIEIYRRGAQMAADAPALVALLVSMHLTGLLTGRSEPGAMRMVEQLEESERRLAERFLEEEDERQADLRDEVGIDPMPLYRALQAFDRLSLILTMQPLEDLTATKVGHIPDGPDLEVRREGGEVVVHPWPFSKDELSLAVPFKGLGRETFSDREELRVALRDAGAEELRFELRPL